MLKGKEGEAPLPPPLTHSLHKHPYRHHTHALPYPYLPDAKKSPPSFFAIKTKTNTSDPRTLAREATQAQPRARRGDGIRNGYRDTGARWMRCEIWELGRDVRYKTLINKKE